MQSEQACAPRVRRAGWVLGGVLLTLISGTTARANIIHVNNTADAGGAGICALRDAVTAATTNAAVNGCGAGSGDDTIVFDVSGTITLSSALYINADTAALTIDGSGQSVTLDGNRLTQVINIFQSNSLTVKYLTISNGLAPDGRGSAIYGFGINKLTILNSTFANNFGACGGAIAVEGNAPDAVLTVVNSTFYANQATTVNNLCGSASGYGGAINSTETALTITNSTFSSNSGKYGAQIVLVRAPFTLANTILTNSLEGPTCLISGSPLVTVSGMNLVGDTSCGSDPQHFSSADPLLGPLADNGGPTPTMALLTGSPAFDAGDNAVCAAAPVNNLDQRGQFRPTDGNNDGVAACDIGAYELAVLLPFTGFLSPLNNAPIVNAVNAGRTIPVKFGFGGDRGLNVLAAGFPQSMQVACASGSPVSDVNQTSTAGQSSLTYDPASRTYTYNWKTDRSWSNTCRLFTMRLIDGTDHTAMFQFK